jgi:hypothetical protein
MIAAGQMQMIENCINENGPGRWASKLLNQGANIAVIRRKLQRYPSYPYQP